jgi:hypothetical protein
VAAPFDISLSFSDDETYVFALEFRNNDGSIMDLSTSEFDYVLRTRSADPSTVFEISSSPVNGITKDLVTGVVTFRAPSNPTPAQYEHGCLWTLTASGDARQLFDGLVDISEGNF